MERMEGKMTDCVQKGVKLAIIYSADWLKETVIFF
jgi:hypothetical protein